jgi:hypothetical protein
MGSVEVPELKLRRLLSAEDLTRNVTVSLGPRILTLPSLAGARPFLRVLQKRCGF